MAPPLFLGNEGVQGVDGNHFPDSRAFHEDLPGCLIKVRGKLISAIENSLGGPCGGVVSEPASEVSGAYGCHLSQEEALAVDVGEDSFLDGFLSKIFRQCTFVVPVFCENSLYRSPPCFLHDIVDPLPEAVIFLALDDGEDFLFLGVVLRVLCILEAFI